MAFGASCETLKLDSLSFSKKQKSFILYFKPSLGPLNVNVFL